MDSINTIQALIGEELTEDWVHLLVKAPFEHLLELLNALSPVYYDWLENEISQSEAHEGTKTTHYCIDPYPREIPWNQWAEKYKQLLLYYPSIAIPDPLAQTLHPFITLAHLFKRLGFGGFPVDEADLRQRLNDSMSVLVQLRPFLQDRSIILQPSPFVIDYEIVQSAADKDLTSMQGEMKERYYEKLYDIAESDYATFGMRWKTL